MLKIDFQTLRLFKAVADEENIAKAAKRENIAASAISKRISDFELTLGTRLIQRRRRGVFLTPAGFALLHHASLILDTVKHLEVDLSEYALGIRGHVRIMANISALVQFLPMDLSSFSATHKSVRIDVREGSTPQILSAVAGGSTDIGIVWSDDFPHGVESEPYRSDELVLVVPDSHQLARRRRIAFSEALGYDFIGLEKDSGWHLYINRAALMVQMPIKVRIRVPSFDAVLKMVQADLGISVVPKGVVMSTESDTPLRAIQLSDAWSRRTLRICYKGFGTTLPPAAQLLVGHFRDLLAPIEGTN